MERKSLLSFSVIFCPFLPYSVIFNQYSVNFSVIFCHFMSFYVNSQAILCQFSVNSLSFHIVLYSSDYEEEEEEEEDYDEEPDLQEHDPSLENSFEDFSDDQMVNYLYINTTNIFHFRSQSVW